MAQIRTINSFWRLAGGLVAGGLGFASITYVQTISDASSFLVYSSMWGLYSLIGFLWDFRILRGYLNRNSPSPLTIRKTSRVLRALILILPLSGVLLLLGRQSIDWLAITMVVFLSLPTLALSRALLAKLLDFCEPVIFVALMLESLVRFLSAIFFPNNEFLLVSSFVVGTLLLNSILSFLELKKDEKAKTIISTENVPQKSDLPLFFGMVFFGLATLGTPWVLKIIFDVMEFNNLSLLSYVAIERATVLFIFLAAMPVLFQLLRDANNRQFLSFLPISLLLTAVATLFIYLIHTDSQKQDALSIVFSVGVSNGLLLATCICSFRLLIRGREKVFFAMWAIICFSLYVSFCCVSTLASPTYSFFLSQALIGACALTTSLVLFSVRKSN
jgi:hypothetical protein